MSEKSHTEKEIIEVLKEKGVDKSCHRCGSDSFLLIESFSKIDLHGVLGVGTSESTSMSNIPVVLIGCNNCGAITPHAVYALFEREDKDK